MIGTLLSDRFRLEEKIGSGGMSSVYLAFDSVLERKVAIKLLHADHLADDGHLERFRREARAAARLQHPHVVTVIDAGEDDGRPYIVFEYVEGETLKECIRRHGRLPITAAVAYAIEIGRALAAAHAERLVHRDVKPQNVLIDPDGRAKVTDFGIARSLEQEGLTAAGRVLGTTDYVSPEQALGHEVTEQSDVYSLGIVLFEMLTGDVPFRGESQVAVAMKHVREPLPDVRRLRPEISAALAAVVDRATRKEVANRYATVSEMVHDLEEALAIEAARSGRAEGEATTVLRGLPGDTGGFAPLSVRRPRVALALALGALAAIAAVVAVLAGHTQKGTRGGAAPRASGQLAAVRLASVKDYDPPPGDGSEHSKDVQEAIDDNPSTYWQTEHYNGGQLNKPGVGLYVEASKPVAGQQLALTTSLPGWTGAVYGASTVPATISGWTKLSDDKRVDQRERFDLDTAGRPFRYYLVWITKLPPGADQATIVELSLLAPKR